MIPILLFFYLTCEVLQHYISLSSSLFPAGDIRSISHTSTKKNDEEPEMDFLFRSQLPPAENNNNWNLGPRDINFRWRREVDLTQTGIIHR